MSPKELQAVKQRYGIVGNCDALNRALETALKVARVDLSILIQGENGVGKEVLPRIIHDASARKGKKYLALNCGALPEGTIDSELFGHVEGAFTGSVGRREGYFSAADGGTLFLDEVGELPLQTQVRLLRVLETGEFIPVGSSEVKRTNVRIVAATNVDMQRAIAEGRFREDLYYRLAAVAIHMPALRERGNDIDMLFRKFALEMSERYNMPPVRLDEKAKQMLLQYPWPGNVRQLKNVAESMSVTADEREITPEILERYIPAATAHTLPVLSNTHAPAQIAGQEAHYDEDREFVFKAIGMLRHEIEKLKLEIEDLRQGNAVRTASPQAAPQSFLPYHQEVPHELVPEAEEFVEDEKTDETHDGQLPTKDDLERELIRKALIRFNGHRKQAADQIGISERTLYRKIKEYGLDNL
ncbi:MAG: sigma-54-dependent Fis family transcriptional regulator [Prevotellaceae bacterium]|jgi:sigma-54 dependent transcriptional regulator|nr:sigma-54-dependent Fis family transcriptional regulator [Prevotellaceae bacterium]MBF1075683.1 sigma-54-dependent Fis family transcriptional regulator [Prevotellaceae bacterium]